MAAGLPPQEQYSHGELALSEDVVHSHSNWQS